MSNKFNPSKFFITIIGVFILVSYLALQRDAQPISNPPQKEITSIRKDQSISVCSWNLQNFGKSKTNHQLTFIANTISTFDIVGIQEVVAREGGENAVNRLLLKLDSIQPKAHWAVEISQPTTGNPAQMERYAYFWKKARIQKEGNGFLEPNYRNEIEREPLMCTFSINEKKFTLINFHAVPKGKQPEKEIKYFKYFPKKYPQSNLIFHGDFNVPATNNVFEPLRKLGYSPALIDQKTTLKMKPKEGEYLASAYDNFYFPTTTFQIIEAGILPIYHHFNNDLKATRKISDHVPIYFTFKFR